MHPIERLRYVARSSGAAQRALVSETAAALAAFADDPQALVTACRRVVSRQPWAGSLVWFCARVLSAGDPSDELWEAAGVVAADGTASTLARALPDDATVLVLGWPECAAEALARRGDCRVLAVDVLDEGGDLADELARRDIDACDVPVWGLGRAVTAADVVLVEPTAAGPDRLVVPAGSLAAASVARVAGIPVWGVVPVGRVLPAPMFEEVVVRAAPDDHEATLEVLTADFVTEAVHAGGRAAPAEVLSAPECAVVAELFRGDVF